MDPRVSASGEHHLLDHWELLRARWRLIVGTFLGFVLVAAAASYRLDPVYQASARVLIGDGVSRSMISDRASSIESYLLEQRSFETQLEVITSEPVAERAARKLGRIDAETSPGDQRLVIDGVKNAVAVSRIRDTRIVLIRAQNPWPEGARDVANAVATAYIEYAAEERDEARRQSIAWLTSETGNMREALRTSEEKLVDYLSTEKIDPSADSAAGVAPPDARRGALTAQISAAELEIVNLLRRYRDLHPSVIEARARLSALRRKFASTQAERSDDHRKLIHYRILKRDADLDHELYQVLLKKLKEADLSAGLAKADIRILEVARLPLRAMAPHTARTLGVAAVLGLCLAIALAYAVALFDRSVRTSDDVDRAFGLATLGVVHRFDSDSDDLLAAAAPGSVEGEAFRQLRTNVRFSDVDRPRRVVLVTSTGPAEGKSTVVANLAVSLAQSGRRTLVIDTDLRRPVLHQLFQRTNGRGLADLLAGDADLDQTIQSTHIEDLDLLPSGTRPPNPAELIESARLQQRLSELRERYDYILLDSPPAGALVDASLLCSLSDGVIFVVEPGRFDRRVMKTAASQLERAGARLYGVVLNKAKRDPKAAIYGYYGAEAVAEGAVSRTGRA